ncbi:MAG: HDIG domain-containing protein [bacterium]|nr:HDIG domain-containing protein [bacterium]
MTSIAKRYPITLNVLVIAVTIVFVSVVLVFGRAEAPPTYELVVGGTSPETLSATRFIAIPDEAATERERELARINTEVQFKVDPQVRFDVINDLSFLFSEIEAGAFVRPSPDETPDPEITLTGANPQTISVGTLYEDEELGATAIDGAGLDISESIDIDASAVGVDVGTYAVLYSLLDDGGNVIAQATRTINVVDPAASTTSTTVQPTGTTEPPPTTTTTLALRDFNEQVEAIEDEFPLYRDDVVPFIEQFNEDVARRDAGEREVYPGLVEDALALVIAQMDDGIKVSELQDVKTALVSPPLPNIFAPGLEAEQLQIVRESVVRVVAQSLQANEFQNEVATQALAEVRAAAVDPVTVQYFEQDVIVFEGAAVTSVQLEAINRLQLLEPEEETSRSAIVALGGMAVLLAAFFLWRVAPNLWSQPKHFALLGILLVLAALATRIPEVIQTEDNTAIAYILPAVMFGYMGAILYDPRTALLLAIPVATFTAISTSDPALTIFAAGATVVPVAFVSAVSSRRELRVAVGLSALVLAPLGGFVAWLFVGREEAIPAAIFAFLGGVIGGLVAQGLLSFLENAFRMTTTLTLLDLTDRNHPGLRLLEEQAPGTFNHSILVGTLAGKAARAIGAQPLLAQAAAYYHDLGKTENPQYFIENQFGVSNPHDEIDPIESANIIRSHVSEGLRLSRQLRIPDTVADGIRQHHGTGLMRYFYHKALESDPSIDPFDYRHHGEKPKRKEMAILMISDAVEGAARSLAQEEDPTAASLTKMVDAVVGEKLEDGQLAESELTFGDLTKVKAALVDALIGYYHTRIPYPGFPGSPAEAE